jgi:hypothetical protein
MFVPAAKFACNRTVSTTQPRVPSPNGQLQYPRPAAKAVEGASSVATSIRRGRRMPVTSLLTMQMCIHASLLLHDSRFRIGFAYLTAPDVTVGPVLIATNQVQSQGKRIHRRLRVRFPEMGFPHCNAVQKDQAVIH